MAARRICDHPATGGTHQQPLLQQKRLHHGGGPVGLETLAAALGDDPVTLETVVEPFLLQQGLLMRTPRGRMVTDAARSHLSEAA